MKHGYYLIEHDGFLIPARWDGEQWNHERGKSAAHPNHGNVKGPIALECPIGCTCTTLPNGSIKVDCTQ